LTAGTIGRGTSQLTRTVLPQANAYAMIRRRAAAAGIETKLGNHSFSNGNHGLSQERRHTGKGRCHGKPHLNSYEIENDTDRAIDAAVSDLPPGFPERIVSSVIEGVRRRRRLFTHATA
jgi:hypothetical protein